jgi:hypothetical protein
MNRRMMKNAVPIALVVLLIVVLFVSSVAFAQTNMPDRMELGFNAHAPQVGIAAAIWQNDRSSIGLIQIHGNAKQINPKDIETPAPNMYIYDVDVSPDASKIAIAGENIDDWTGGISLADLKGRRPQWIPVTDVCSDSSLTWVSNDEIEYINCWGMTQALRKSILGGEAVPVLEDGYLQTAIGANPATGKAAIVEIDWVQIAGADTPDYWEDDEWLEFSRIVVVDADGNIVTEMPWLTNTNIFNLKWSDDGSRLMYYAEIYTPDTYSGGLYIGDETGYGVKLQDDAYLADFLPDGGYVYGQIDWINAGTKSHYQTTVTVVPKVGDQRSFIVNGAIDSLDVYLR